MMLWKKSVGESRVGCSTVVVLVSFKRKTGLSFSGLVFCFSSHSV